MFIKRKKLSLFCTSGVDTEYSQGQSKVKLNIQDISKHSNVIRAGDMANPTDESSRSAQPCWVHGAVGQSLWEAAQHIFPKLLLSGTTFGVLNQS